MRVLTDYEQVQKDIREMSLEGALSQRANHIEISRENGGYRILAWQCNVADVQKFDVCLPTVMYMNIDRRLRVREVELMENFKGSQGLPCSQKYLNRRLKEVLLGKSLALGERQWEDPLVFHCRHIYELVIGTTRFLDEMRIRGLEEAKIEEMTKAYLLERGVMMMNHLSCLGENRIYKAEFLFRKENVRMNAHGIISHVKDMELILYKGKDNGEWEEVKREAVKNGEGSRATVLKMMKLLATVWRTVGKDLGYGRNFTFTNLWPSSFYGLFAQTVSLALFQNNYTYFQHALRGIQRGEGPPLCIGIVENLEEAEKYFPDFSMEDL